MRTALNFQQAAALPVREDLLRSYPKTLLRYCTRLSQQHGTTENLEQPDLFGRL